MKDNIARKNFTSLCSQIYRLWFMLHIPLDFKTVTFETAKKIVHSVFWRDLHIRIHHMPPLQFAINVKTLKANALM